LAKLGLHEFVRPEITSQSSLKAALNAAIKKKMIRLITASAGEAVYAVVDEEINVKERDVSYNTESIITYSKEKESLKFSAKRYPELEKHLTHYKTFVTNGQLRTAFLETIKQFGAICLRPMGGIYYCPPETRDLLYRLNLFVESLSEDSYLHFFGVIDGSVAKKALLIALKNEMRVDTDKNERLLTLFAKGKRKLSSSTAGLMENSLDLMRLRVATIKRVTNFDNAVFAKEIVMTDKLEKTFARVKEKRSVVDASPVEKATVAA